MKRKPFFFPMKMRERILGLLVLPLHLFVIPKFVLWLSRSVDFLRLSGAKLNLISYLISFLLLLLCMGSYMKAMFSALLRSVWRCLSSVALCFAGYYLVMFFLASVAARYAPDLTNPNDNAIALTMAGSKTSFILLALLIAPIVEELIFRGVIFGSIRTKSRAAAYIASFALFAFYHLYPYFFSAYSPKLFLNLLQYLPASLALAYCYERSECICAPIALHILINSGSVFSIF